MLSFLSMAQVGNLEILNEKGNVKKNNPVRLEKLEVTTKIVGNLSNTIVTMEFLNSSNNILEGRLTFPLPEGVTISGYALDINGKLRTAVPVEKEKAKEVFESIVRKKVDPGIIEKVEGNNFRTRIYPIPAKGKRIVQISYNQNLKTSNGQLYYNFVFNKDLTIPEFNLNVQVFDEVNIPKLEQRPDGDFNFVKQGNVWTAKMSQKDFKSKTNLRVYLEPSLQPKLISQAASGNYYFLLNDPIVGKTKARVLPKTIGLIWDASLSMINRDLKKELQLLEDYFKLNKNVTVRVVLLNNRWGDEKQFNISNSNFAELKQYLSNINYDGGTDYSQLKNMDVDEYLFFTDGISGFGDLKLNLKKPVFCITSNVTSNFSQLQYISSKTGGEVINIASNDLKSEIKKLLFSNLKFLGIKPNSAITEVYPKTGKTIDNAINIAGISSAKSTEITLLFGFDNQVTEERKVNLDFEKNTSNNWNIAQVWAQNKIEELELQPKEYQKEIKAIGKQFGIVTSNTSLIVLENLDDYVKHNIIPPDELRADYDKSMKSRQDNATSARKNIMSRAENMTEELKTWWNTDFSNIKKYPKVDQVAAQADRPNNNPRSRSDTTNANQQIEEVVVVGYATQSTINRSSSSVVTIENALAGSVAGIRINTVIDEIKANVRTLDIKSTEAYMTHFEALKSADSIYRKYLKQRPEYKDTPSYYFDIANLLFNLNENELGLRVLSSITDLDLENEELYKLVLYQLKKQGVNDKSVFIAKKILDWRPMDPQSYRDYALALEDNGEYQEALTQLYKIFIRDYTEEIAARDFMIEETVLMELNQLINYRKASPTDINPKLLAELPVNIRVVLNWNKDNTDIDLWVTDPNDEKCMYSHEKTEIGGRISQDFTGGFGPEQFLLKKAIKGKYKIETNFYGDDQVSISGPTALMAEVFLNYASGKQERKIVVFQSAKKDNGGDNNGVLIAEFDY